MSMLLRKQSVSFTWARHMHLRLVLVTPCTSKNVGFYMLILTDLLHTHLHYISSSALSSPSLAYSPYSFLHLLTPIDFWSFSIQSNHFNFGPPAFPFTSGFPRSTSFTVQCYIYCITLIHTSYTTQTLYVYYHSSSASAALLSICHRLYISVWNFVFSRPGSPPTINHHCVCFTGSLPGVLIKFSSTSVIGSISKHQNNLVSYHLAKDRGTEVLWLSLTSSGKISNFVRLRIHIAQQKCVNGSLDGTAIQTIGFNM
jgi:hypothetical protein